MGEVPSRCSSGILGSPLASGGLSRLTGRVIDAFAGQAVGPPAQTPLFNLPGAASREGERHSFLTAGAARRWLAAPLRSRGGGGGGGGGGSGTRPAVSGRLEGRLNTSLSAARGGQGEGSRLPCYKIHGLTFQLLGPLTVWPVNLIHRLTRDGKVGAFGGWIGVFHLSGSG